MHDDYSVEALYFDFLHFYGTANQIGVAGYGGLQESLGTRFVFFRQTGSFLLFWTKIKKGVTRGRSLLTPPFIITGIAGR